ncbi:MAG: molecular chaperone [Acidobacteria bacterium]|nr:MAG: molecular chaperone [Acidobacteriota bacterium]
MAQKHKARGGDGARTQPETTKQSILQRRGEPSRLPSLLSTHPLGRLREEMDALFDRFFSRWPAPAEWGWSPSLAWDVNVEDLDKEIVVRAEAPGFEPQDFDIHVSGNMLTIRAEHKQEAEQEKEGFRSWERRYGRFQRTIPLSAAVNPNQVTAHYRSGVLEVHLPRTEEAQRRRIEVKA